MVVGAPIKRTLCAAFEVPLGSDDRFLGDAFGWVKGQFFSLTVDRPLRFVAERAEKKVTPGLVRVDNATDVSAWTHVDDPTQLGLTNRRGRRLLLLIHGTFSSTIGGFQALTGAGAFLETAIDEYDAVLGFDHRTLTLTPEDNARDLLEALSEVLGDGTAAMDVVVHSRGGLVARSLIENLLKSRRRRNAGITVRNVVFVGSPNAGTALVHPKRIKAFIDTYTTLTVSATKVIGAVTGAAAVAAAVAQVISGLAAVAEFLLTRGIDREAIPGLSAMNPDGDFIDDLSRRLPPQGVTYYAVTSDYEPRQHGLSGELPLVVADAAADRLFRRANDLVVDTQSMTDVGERGDSSRRRTAFRRVLEFDSDIYHTIYFTQRLVSDSQSASSAAGAFGDLGA